MKGERARASECAMEKTRLAVLWTTEDWETVLGVVLPYVKRAALSGRFETVRLAVRGPSVRVMCGSGDVMRYVAELSDSGVEVMADMLSAQIYGAAETLKQRGVELTDVGAALTGMVCSGWQIMSL